MLPSVQTRSGNHHRPCLQMQDHLQDRNGCLCLFLPARPQPLSPAAPLGSLPHRCHYPSSSPEASPPVRCTLPPETQASPGHLHPRTRAPDKRVMCKVADPEKAPAGSQAPSASRTPRPT